MTKADYDNEKVRTLRKARRWTQSELAKRVKRSLRTIQRVEQGEHASFDALRQIAAKFDVQVTELIYDRPKRMRA